MFLFTFNNTDIWFAEKELNWRSYPPTEALPNTNWVEFIDKKEFAKAALDEEYGTFVVHVAALEAPLAGMTIYPLGKAQILALI